MSNFYVDLTSPYLAEAVYNFIVDVASEDYEEKRAQSKNGLSMLEYVVYYCPNEFREYAKETGWLPD